MVLLSKLQLENNVVNIFPLDNKKHSYIAATAVLIMCFVNLGVLGSSFFGRVHT